MMSSLFVVILVGFFTLICAGDGVSVTLSNYNVFPLYVYWDGGKDPSTGNAIEAFIDTIQPSESIAVNTFVGT